MAWSCHMLWCTLNSALQLTGKASIGVAKIAKFNFDDFEKRAWVDEWRGTFFRQLWTLREELEFQGYKIQQNLRAVKRITYIANLEDSRAGSRHQLMPDLIRLGKEQEREREREQERDDEYEWEGLEQLRLYAFRIMERTTDSYLQTVQATGAQFANKQSKRFRSILEQRLYHKLITVIVSDK